MRVVFPLIGLIILAMPVAGHELAVYTVVVNSSGPQPADIPNGSLIEGDAVWFWMKDSTENTTLEIELIKDGNVHRSSTLYYECELDDNGSKVNDECENRYDFYFNQSYAVGAWNIVFYKYADGELSETINGSVIIGEDIHPSDKVESESITVKDIAIITAIVSLVIMAFLLTQILESNNEKEE